jgi:hypothetical protein
MKYDAKLKKIITKEWGNEFPTLTILKPTRLIRRNGPILVGICLDRESNPEVYKPIVHIHNLCYIDSDISISLAGYVLSDKGLPTVVKLKYHSETFLHFVQKIKLDYPFTDKSEMSFNDIVVATQKYVTGRTAPYQHKPYNDLITIAAYLGKKEYALESLENFSAIISEWPDRAFNIIGSVDKWRNSLLELIDNTDKLRETVDQEIVKHKLVKFMDNGLIWPEKPLNLWEMPCKPMFA